MQTKEELKEALNSFLSATNHLVSVWTDDNMAGEDILNNLESNELYPFETSFDNVAFHINEWIEKVEKELEEDD